jgi:hypothetical protein
MKIITVLATLLLSYFATLSSGQVVRSGTCTGGSETTIELWREDGGRLEVDFDVDTNRRNSVWTVVILRNGRQVYRRNHRTNRWGEIDVEILLAGLTGNITAQATSVSTSERCVARARFQ